MDHYEESHRPIMQAENQGRSASLASLVVEGEPAVLLASKLSGAQVLYGLDVGRWMEGRVGVSLL